jgi:hypothetical protein
MSECFKKVTKVTVFRSPVFRTALVLFLLAIFTARNHRLLAFLLPKAAKGSKNALTPTSSADPLRA